MEIQFFRSALSARNSGYPIYPTTSRSRALAVVAAGNGRGASHLAHQVRFGTSYLQDCAIPFLGTVIITRHGGALDFAT
jgi:hypothetical protein